MPENFSRILRIVRMLPGIAQVHVEADGHHQPAFVVIDPAPVRHVAVVLIRPARANVLLAGHLEPVVQIVDGVKDGVLVVDLHDGPVGKHPLHAVDEDLPLFRPVEIVAHEEAAAQQILPHGLGLRVGQVPVAHFHGVEPRPIVLVAFVQVDRLLHRPRVHARQAPQRLREMAVRARIIGGPTGAPLRPIPGGEAATEPAEPPPAPVDARHRRVHQAGEGPLGLLLPVLGNREVAVLDAGVFAERPLGEQSPQKDHSAEQ